MGFLPLRVFGTRFVLSNIKNRIFRERIYSELTFCGIGNRNSLLPRSRDSEIAPTKSRESEFPPTKMRVFGTRL